MDDVADDQLEREAYGLEELKQIGQKWMDRIKTRLDAEDAWFKEAEKAEVAYLADTESKDALGASVPDFNILHSNVETIVPSIYNSTPVPDIRPRHNVKDAVGKAVADIIERAISAQIDDNALDTEIEATAQDVFVAGRGITRVRFDAEIGMMGVTGERLIYENVSWRDYVFGACKKFKDRPWEAFRHAVSVEELERLEDEGIAAAYGEEAENKEKLDEYIWEIWCRESGRVYFIADASHKVISIKDDPLGLKDFFTVPGIVQPIKSTANTIPVVPYKIYRKLAEELDTVTRRINAITGGLKVRGIYAGDAEAIEQLAELGDNELVPVANIENLVATGGLDKAVMWWPIETAIAVLRELYVQREQTKQAIYEITGISDIVRGASSASETATAQQIKTQWGSLRIKKMQRMVERHVRDIFKLSAEIICKHFSPQALQRMSGIPMQQEFMQILGRPFDHYRIDVESDSTVRADLTRSRGEMAQFLEGTAQFFNAMAPIVAQAPQTAVPAVQMYSAFARQFNLGKQAEDALEALVTMAEQSAGQPRPNPEAELAKEEMDLKKTQQQQQFMLGVIDKVLKGKEIEQGEKRLQIDEAKAEVDAAQKFAELDKDPQKPGIQQ